jgi:hypothetical protein
LDLPDLFDDLAHGACRYRWESSSLHPDLTFQKALPILANGWENASHGSTLSWQQALPAIRDAWLPVSPQDDQRKFYPS